MYKKQVSALVSLRPVDISTIPIGCAEVAVRKGKSLSVTSALALLTHRQKTLHTVYVDCFLSFFSSLSHTTHTGSHIVLDVKDSFLDDSWRVQRRREWEQICGPCRKAKPSSRYHQRQPLLVLSATFARRGAPARLGGGAGRSSQC